MDEDTEQVDETVSLDSDDEISDEKLLDVVGGLTPVSGESTDDKHKQW